MWPCSISFFCQNYKKKPLWPLSVSELYRLSDRRKLAKSVPTFSDRWCRVVSATDPHGRILEFLDRNCYYSFQAAPQLYSRGWVDPPELHRRHNDIRLAWFQQRAATSHTARISMQTVREMFLGVISRNGDIARPPCTPQLSTCDYFLRG
jgi:hypothetical protein